MNDDVTTKEIEKDLELETRTVEQIEDDVMLNPTPSAENSDQVVTEEEQLIDLADKSAPNVNPQTVESITDDFSGLKLKLASPEEILNWSKGEVTKPETINYRTFKPEKDGLFDERIFGPTKDFECYCGKYKRIRYKGIVCDRCGVEVTISAVRRERMGHIRLASPVAHIWYFKSPSAPISVLLDITTNNIERVIYYALYIVKEVEEGGRSVALAKIKEVRDIELKTLDEWKNSQDESIKTDEDKEKSEAKAKIKNSEQLDLTVHEISHKYRERYATVSSQFNEKKAQKQTYFEHIIKVVENVVAFATVEEEDYLFLREHGVEGFLTVGMGSETIHEILSGMDLKTMHTELFKVLAKMKASEKRMKILKKVRLLEWFIASNVAPNWMCLQVLPVLPPDLRPVVQLSGGKFATSDLNDFYRRVINRNNRLRHLIELGAPEIILRNEKRMLQEAVDALIDSSKARGSKKKNTPAGTVTKELKSLADILKGKQGRFRQNLLGKRVDYSGRSVIIVGPELKLNQCGLPKEMAIELFKPYLLHEVIIRGLAQNIKSAKSFLDTKDPVIYDILEEITKNHPVILNRAPTLHKLSILGFYPVLTDDYAIKLHPCVCAGYNADFDGDQMGVFVPLSEKSKAEVADRMMAEKNLLKPSDGSPIVFPNKEMALGVYYITTIDNNLNKAKDEELMQYSDIEEVLVAYGADDIATRQPIMVRIDGKMVRTSAGRIIFNEKLPEKLRFINEDVKAPVLKKIVVAAGKLYGEDYTTAANLIDDLKSLGFWGATIAGLSISVFDCVIIENKSTIIATAEKKVKEIEQNFMEGLITEPEKRRLSNGVWMEVTEKIADLSWEATDEENPVKISIKSEATRASKDQVKQLSAMKGLVTDPLGNIIEVPTKSNYREGFSVFEYVINARGARKGYIDSALKTADAGYLTRRLVDVSHEVIIREHDCGTTDGLLISQSGNRSGKFFDRIKGRHLALDLNDELKAGALIDGDNEALVKKLNPTSLKMRSPLFCKTSYGVCQMCYGIDLSTSKGVEIGVPVGVMAAQSIGEPGTQLTMRVRHFGGIVTQDVTQGLPRVEEILEMRRPKTISPITDISGKVAITEETEKDLFVVSVKSTDQNGETREYQIPTSKTLLVKNGQLVSAGTPLCEGHHDINELLRVKGLVSAQQYLIDEVQKVYESQGIGIHDRHFEVIVRKMSDRYLIEQEGDTEFVVGDIVSKYKFDKVNRTVIAQGGRPAIGEVKIYGVTSAAMNSDSWLSSASFQGTTKLLTEASIRGQIDPLYGLKENVIIGRLIPTSEELLNKYYANN